MKKILLTLLLIAAGAELAAQTGRNPNPLRDLSLLPFLV